jgi:hypothetical protein
MEEPCFLKGINMNDRNNIVPLIISPRSIYLGMVYSALVPNFIIWLIAAIIFRFLFQSISIAITAILVGLLIMYPILLGLILAPSRKGILGGVAALLVFAFLICYLFVAFISFALAIYIKFPIIFGIDLSPIIYIGIFSLIPALMIMAMYLVIKKENIIQQILHVVGAGAIGLGVVFLLFFLFTNMYMNIKKDQLVFLINDLPMIFGIMGSTIIYFDGLFTKIIRWRGAIIWVLLLVVIYYEQLIIAKLFGVI